MGDRLQSIINARGPIRKIGVVGMGYVGIPAAVLFADAPEFKSVLGFQRGSPSSGYKVDMLNRGESPLKGEEPGLEELLAKVVAAGKFRCTSDFSEIAGCDAVTLAIQTPFADPKDLIPDFSALIEGLRNVGKHLTEGMLVVLESTVTPGTTERMAREILEEESGLVAGEDFALAHAPERVMVGRLLRNIREHDRIVGGIDDVSTRRAMELYAPVLTAGKIIPMTATAAEVTKTAENAFRDLQIAAANQLALHCEAMGVNVYDVRAGIDSLKGEGITRAILWPGAGVGGHCLTKDSWHLERGAQVLGGDLWYPHGEESIFGVARTINEFMPRHMVHLTTERAQAGREVPGGRDGRAPRVGVHPELGRYQKHPCRALPCGDGGGLGQRSGSMTPSWTTTRGWRLHTTLTRPSRGRTSSPSSPATTTTPPSTPPRVKELSGREHPVIIDGRNVVDPDAFIRAGFIYKGIGRGDKNSHPVR